MTEKCAMAAIVLDHEQPHEEARGRQREQQADPISKIEHCPHQKPKQSKRTDRDRKLDDAAPQAGHAVASKDVRPAASVGRGRIRRGILTTVRHLSTKLDAHLPVSASRASTTTLLSGR